MNEMVIPDGQMIEKMRVTKIGQLIGANNNFEFGMGEAETKLKMFNREKECEDRTCV